MPRGMGRLVGAGWWAALDQAVFSASNLFLSLLLARTLQPSGFGTFAFAFSILVLLGTLHSALLIEPMLVLAPARYGHRLAEYLRVLTSGHVALTGLFAVVLLVAAGGAWLAGERELAPALAAVAVAVPCVLLLWLARRGCYIRLEPRRAAAAGLLYLVLLLGSAELAARGAWLSAPTALGLMAVTSLLTGGWLMRSLGVGAKSPSSDLYQAVRGDHWAYGRFAVLSAVLIWVPGNIYFLALPAFGAVGEAGAFRAMLLMLMPLLLMQGALGLVMLPALAGASSSGEARRLLRAATRGTLVVSVLYGLVLVVESGPLIRLVFTGRYLELTSLLPFVGLVGMTEGHAAMVACGLRARMRPDLITRSAVIASLVAAAVGLPLAWAMGSAGAIIGWLISSATFALALQAHYRALDVEPAEDSRVHSERSSPEPAPVAIEGDLDGSR